MRRVPVLDRSERVKLAEPRRDGGVALERCLAGRRSVRSFRDLPLGDGQLGQLLWAAQGATAAGGGRAAPSAGALYPLELSVVCGGVDRLAAGVYRYLPPRHELHPVVTGDRREELAGAALGQDWIATAPVVICIAAVFERTTVKYGNRGRGFVYMEAGHAAENVMLQAVALGLVTTMVGAFGDAAVKRILHLDPDETPLCLIPVGAP